MLRSDFDIACGALIEKYKDAPVSPATDAFKGWGWHEHPTVTGLGYMSRHTTHTRTRSPCLDLVDLGGEDEHDSDDATAPISARACDLVTCHQYVVHSASFQVPAFYFTMHDANGSPLSLADLVATSLFRPTLADVPSTVYALTPDGSNFPLLSQGDHPTLGTVCWYLHPCETSAAVDELMSEDGRDAGPGQTRLWLERWFLVLGTAVDTRY